MLDAAPVCGAKAINGRNAMTTGRRIGGYALVGAWAATLAFGAFATRANAAETLNVCHGGHPIMEASIKILEKWAKKFDVNVTSTTIAYAIFVPKITQILTTNSPQCDIVWHNDDWGQLWKQYLVTTDDVPGVADFPKPPLDAFWNDDHKLTVVPMVHTVGTFFYRTDLVPENEVPKTLDELVQVSEKLQKAGKVKWGYVGGMSMNNTWFSLWWTMWANNCDILKPLFERDNDKLTAAKFEPAVTEPCHREIVEFWWDAINTHKISPPGMTAYGRNEANAIFMAGEAAFTLVDSTHFGEFNDPKRSKIVGKIGMAPFPVGPRAQKPTSWNEIWGWAITKGVSAERKKLGLLAPPPAGEGWRGGDLKCSITLRAPALSLPRKRGRGRCGTVRHSAAGGGSASPEASP